MDLYNNNKQYTTPAGAIQDKNSWSKKINHGEYQDEYQLWAFKNLRLTESVLLPYLFSKTNVKFIQKSVVNYVKQFRNITINTQQDEDTLLNMMVAAYTLYLEPEGTCQFTKDCTGNTQNNYSYILGNINKYIIEMYVKKVISSIDMYKYYIKDISNMPKPLSLPTLITNKGSNSLGFKGYFEDNHKYTNDIASFNMQNLI